MDPPEQGQWLTTHIPHRVRAAIARLPMENSILRGTATIDPHCRTEQDHIYWRCATDSIWEARLAATRWLIEFVGIKQDDAGQAAVCRKSKKFGGKDVRSAAVEDIDLAVHPDFDTRRVAAVAQIFELRSGSRSSYAQNFTSMASLSGLPVVLYHAASGGNHPAIRRGSSNRTRRQAVTCTRARKASV